MVLTLTCLRGRLLCRPRLYMSITELTLFSILAKHKGLSLTLAALSAVATREKACLTGEDTFEEKNFTARSGCAR